MNGMKAKAKYKVPRNHYYCRTRNVPGAFVAAYHLFVLDRGVVSEDLFSRLDEAIRQCGTGVTYTKGPNTHVWSVPAWNGRSALSLAVQPFCA